MLLHYIGEEAYDIFDSFTDTPKGIGAVRHTDDGDEPDEYAAAKKSLTDYFTPKRNTAYEVFKFRQAVQNAGESMDAFHTRLRSLASSCDFHNTEREILSQIIQGCCSSRLRKRALKDDMTLANVLAEARASELSDARAAEIEQASCSSASSINAIKQRQKQQHHSTGFREPKSQQEQGHYSDSGYGKSTRGGPHFKQGRGGSHNNIEFQRTTGTGNYR